MAVEVLDDDDDDLELIVGIDELVAGIFELMLFVDMN